FAAVEYLVEGAYSCVGREYEFSSADIDKDGRGGSKSAKVAVVKLESPKLPELTGRYLERQLGMQGKG
ncbi:hypothetical protein RUND412_008067, partial [Rhizina undulata]